MYVCVRACAYANEHVSVCACVSACACVYIHRFVYMYVVRICLYVCAHTFNESSRMHVHSYATVQVKVTVLSLINSVGAQV